MELPTELQMDIFELLDHKCIKTLRLTGQRRLTGLLRQIRTLKYDIQKEKIHTKIHLFNHARFAALFDRLANLYIIGHIIGSFKPVSLWKLIHQLPLLQLCHLETEWSPGEALFGDHFQEWISAPVKKIYRYKAPPSLHTLRFIGYNVHSSESTDFLVPESLTELVLLPATNEVFLQFSPYLTRLSLSKCYTYTLRQIRSLPTTLTSLKLRHCSHLDGTCFIALPRGLTSLVITVRSYSDESLRELPMGLISLKLISFLHSDAFGDAVESPPTLSHDCLRFLPPSLQSLDLKTTVLTKEAVERAPPNLLHITFWKLQDLVAASLPRTNDLNPFLGWNIPPTLHSITCAETSPYTRSRRRTFNLRRSLSSAGSECSGN
jgi:hypothetical protein